ncbi:hypothetical protein CONPUDRAFT_125805, partial [Coniophora puteana RWD-64-598 SS2]
MNRGKDRPAMKIAGHIISPKHHHKLLGVILDQELRWKEQVASAIGKGAAYAQQLWRLSRTSAGLSLKAMRQLHRSVVTTKILYAASVWLPPPIVGDSETAGRGSITTLKKIRSVQRLPLLSMTGALRTSPIDLLEVLTDVAPAVLTAQRVCHTTAIRMAALPATNPVTKLFARAARMYVKHHRSALHYLVHRCGVHPGEVESLHYPPPFVSPTPLVTDIAGSKKEAVEKHNNRGPGTVVYSDGSSHNGRVGAAAILIRDDGSSRSLRHHLGTERTHTVFEAELVGVILALHLL